MGDATAVDWKNVDERRTPRKRVRMLRRAGFESLPILTEYNVVAKCREVLPSADEQNWKEGQIGVMSVAVDARDCY